MSQEYQNVLKQHILNHKPFYVHSHSSWFLVIFDLILRIILFILLKLQLISYSEFLQNQIFYISILTIIVAGVRVRFLSTSISNKLNITLFSPKPSFKLILSIIGFVIFLFFILDNVLYDQPNMTWTNKTLTKLVFILFYFLFILFTILVLSPTKKVSGEIKFYPDNKNTYYCLPIETLDSINNGSYLFENEIGELDIDNNDQSLTNLETDAKNIAGKLDVFTIECVFIGALAFSAFISIISSDIIQLDLPNIHSLFSILSESFFSIISFNFELINKNFILISEGIYLFGLLSLIALSSSIFFLLALANRMVLHNNIDKLNHIVNLAIRFNAKEEELNLLVLQSVLNLNDRQLFLKNKLTSLIDDGKKIYTKIIPLYKIVAVLRWIGLHLFYLLLIAGGLFFSYSLSFFIFITLIVSTLIRTMINGTTNKIINIIFEINKIKAK